MRAWLTRVLLVGCAVAVIAGMLVVADRAHEQADRARRAQVLMERVRAGLARVDVMTSRNLALGPGVSEASVTSGISAYVEVGSGLRELQRLGVAPAAVRRVERQVDAAYGSGMAALALARRDADAGRERSLADFLPALERTEASASTAARQLDAAADAAQVRIQAAYVGSIAIGLLLLALLAWRLHRLQRAAALAEQARATARRGDERLHALMRHSSDVVAIIDAGSTVRWIAESVRKMLGYEPEQLVGRRLGGLAHPDDEHRAVGLREHIAAGSERLPTVSLRARASDGSYRQLEIVPDNGLDDPLIEGILINVRDVTERVALEDALHRQAFHDSLTGLANRALFEDRLAHALTRQRRHGGCVAAMFLDLDDFKTVNDSLGHAVGDELLRGVAQRLEDTLRAQDTAARLGGDEFGVLLENPAGEAEALEVAGRVGVALQPPLTIAGRRLTASASIGVACAEPGDTPDDLMRKVDVAMYAAKERGKGRVAAFETSMQHRVIERLELGSELGDALAGDELTLDYQPIVALADGAIVELEALVRWEHPTRGRLFPDRFIALAESTGLIVPIGAWILHRACAQLRAWQDAHASGPALGVSVNVSAAQLADPGFESHVRAALASAGLDPGRLTLELTEGLLVDDSGTMQRRLRALKQIGVRLAVDDFGTGYSALSYLRSFPVDLLKIDRSFVPGLDSDPWRARLVSSIVDMAHNLGLAVVTEGIESAAEAALLADLGSDFGQGYHFARPLGVAAVDQLLARASSLPAA